MKSRHVYALKDRQKFDAAVAAVRACGVDDDDISIVARHDIELAIDPEAPHDEHGRLAGLLAGLSAVTVPTLGVSIAGAGLLNLLGANLGAWVRGVSGEHDHEDDDVRAYFQERIDRGEILLVVDAAPEMHGAVNAQLVVLDAEPLRFGGDPGAT